MTGERAQAEPFAALFRAVYRAFRRRDGPQSQLAGASRAVLEHLAPAGPLTIGEAAAHLVRAQPVISQIVTHLERPGLLEREDDPAGRRRTLTWLTPSGHEALRRDREVPGVDPGPHHRPAAARPGPRPYRRAPDPGRPGHPSATTTAGRTPRTIWTGLALTTAQACGSCGMPIKTSRYCQLLHPKPRG